MTYQLTRTHTFKKQFQNYQHNTKVITKFSKILEVFINNTPLPSLYRDHQLKGERSGYREFHLFPDILIIYEKDEKLQLITLVAIGSHSALFS